ncbi:MAG: FecR family protein [Bacteroidaceae bacterium]
MMENRLKESSKEKWRDLFSDKGYLKGPMTEHMHKQWEDAATKEVNGLVGKRIWGGIERNMLVGTIKRVSHYYKYYSIAASIALLVAFSGMIHFLMESQDIPYMYVVNTGVKGKQMVTLSDGTIVTMGPSSKLTYPSQFKDAYRKVSLEGQAYFEVAKNREKPFTVNAGRMHITALGTAFEVFNYADNDLAETILANGKVEVVFDQEHCKQKTLLLPNEMVSFYKKRSEFSLHKIDAQKAVAWHEDKFLCFEKATLSAILPRLEQWYGRTIYYNVDKLPKAEFSFKVRDESIEAIFSLMKRSIKLDFKKKDENYILTINH